MKLVGAISTAVLSLTLGVGIPAYAQQEQHEQQDENKDKPAQEKDKKEQPAKPEEKNARQQENKAKPEEKNAQQLHTQEARPGNQEQRAAGGRIPADRYKANFGSGHHFRVSQSDYSNRRFQYGGYSFGFVDAWPSNWLYTQDVYVVEIDGVYYLCNASFPGVNLALSITL